MRIVLHFLLAFVFANNSFGQVGIGTTAPDPSAKLDVTSTNSGLLPPRMTSAQRNAIVNPTPGLIIFNTTTNSLEIFAGLGWGTITFSPAYIKKLLGGGNDDRAYSIQNTNDGGYLIAGISLSSASGDVTGVNHGAHEFWILKIDATGNISWNKLLGGTGADGAYSIQQTIGGGCIVVGYSGSSANGDVTGTNHGPYDYWIVKLDGAGNIVWNKLLGGSGSDIPHSIQQTEDGGYIVAGSSSSSANGDVTDINHGSLDYWIMKLDGTGNIVWNKLLGGTGSEEAFSIQQTFDGGYIVGGYSRSSANGNVTETNHGGDEFWIVKLDGVGNIVWNRLLGGVGLEQANSIQQTTDGGYIVAGYSTSTVSGNVTGTNHGINDYWIVKLDGLGNIVWNKLLGGANFEIAQSIQQTSDRGYIVAGLSSSSVTGDVTGTSHGDNDFWIVKLDGLGNIVWNKLLGGNNAEIPYSIKETPDGGYIVAGYSLSSANGDVTGTNHGTYDWWIIKLDRNGNPF